MDRATSVVQAAPKPRHGHNSLLLPVTTAASDLSVLQLSADGGLRRVPVRPDRPRSDALMAGFESLLLFYDVFRDVSGRFVFLVGPMALNLAPFLDAMRITGLPSLTRPRVQVHHGAQVTIVRVPLPAGDTDLTVEIGGQVISGAIRANAAAPLAGRRAVFCINKNNDLAWIRDWARFYAVEHGADAVAVYDNGSDRYTSAAIADALAEGAPEAQVMVIEWPFRYGYSPDPEFVRPFGNDWVRFAQPGMFVHFLRQHAASARSILNVDIDELVVSPRRHSIFRAVERRPLGLMRFVRLQIENISEETDTPRHANFAIRRRGAGARGGGKKWALVPGRAWLAGWRAQPWTHKVYNWPRLTAVSHAFFGYHLLGITIGWKKDRRLRPRFDPAIHTTDTLLRRVLDDIFGKRDDH